jgi:hypothetical protein
MNGSYAQLHMQQMQYSGMIGSGSGGGGMHSTSEGIAAGGLSRGAAIGAPMATAGLAFAGLDPVSLAIRGGMASYGAGAGIGGAVAGGLAMAAPMAAGIGAVSYMGNQMMTGAQQVQSFNQNMRGSFGFMNRAAPGGRGFDTGDTREIASTVRSISSTGEQGFDELGRLAAGMGRMGMAQGVRNAKEFNEKFREMLKTVKTIATELGTTMEEAQTLMASMRGSGIFSKQGQVAQSVRQASVAGGLATTEVTGMMSVGSQISRLFGGTGKQGAMGGMETIAQIGTAQKSGILSEEDIYNATGQTGADGRRAFAMQQMQGTGQFLRSAKGRYFLASVAGKDGQLDQESVNNWMGGGMGVEQTRGQANKNLQKVGRANFIRNEGRLRGAVMEQFGGMAPAMAMMQWAGERGIDINDMDDRSMLFAQRQLGMGRDEADAAFKMARKLPELMQARRTAREEDSLIRDTGERQKRSGLEGIKRRFDTARNQINNEMQKVGQDVMTSATESIERFANQIAGVYEERVIEGIREAQRAASMGGEGGARIMRNLVGGRGQQDAGLAALSKGRGGGGAIQHENIGQRNLLEKVQELRFSANMGETGALSKTGQDFVTSNRDMLRKEYSQGGIAGLGGEDRIAAVRQLMRKQGGDAYKEFKGMNESERAAYVQRMEREIGIGEESRLGTTFKDPKFQSEGMLGLFGDSPVAELVGGQGGPRTEGELHDRRGRDILGLKRGGAATFLDAMTGGAKVAALGKTILQGNTLAGAVSGFKKDGILGGLKGLKQGFDQGIRDTSNMMTAPSALGDMAERISGRGGMAASASRYLDSEEGRQTIFGLLNGEQGATEAAQNEANRLLSRQARGEKLTEDEVGRLGIVQRGMIASDLQKAVSAKGGLDKLSDSDWDGMVNQLKQAVKREGGDPDSVTRDSVRRMYGELDGAATKQKKEIVSKLASQTRKTSLETQKSLRAGGVAQFKDGNLILSDKAKARLEKEGGAGAAQAMALALKAEGMSSGLQGTEASFETDRNILLQQQGLQGEFYDRIANMSTKELRAMAQVGAGTQPGDIAAEQLMLGKRMSSRLKKRGSTAAGAIAGELGLNLSQDELAGMKGLSSSEAASRLASKLGVSGDETFRKGLEEALGAAGSSGGGQKAATLLSRAVKQADQTTRTKLDEAQGRGPNPLDKIADKISEGNKHLEVLVKSNKDAQQYLRDISSNTQNKDAEKGGEA